ncbi:hypothetical protein C0Q70_03536 [Pomacea canaliculata]|uniref:Uncharacterized protein n=1 Tax=Pomacea canaliculata TaxID=400727 RepID=A0A2T7PT00_POMCA|nr:hypothetical protein C0Q70_03536 [Pomacea canaliculata]
MSYWERATTSSGITLTGTTKKPVVCQEYNLTFVSAFFDFGDHQKGGDWRTVQTYYPWSEAFGRIYAPLIFYTDSDKFGEHIRQLRAHMAPNFTHVISVNRSTLWPFQYKDIIARLYAQTNYPKHEPNTVVPEYSCSMHAKYACLHDAMVLQHGLVTTHFVAWVDIGYYRDLRNPNISYCIVPPKDFNETKVLYNQVYMPNFNLSARDIFYDNDVWVGGGMFIATREVMLRLCDEYKRAATFLLLERNLSSTDQQTLYASMTTEGKRDVKIDCGYRCATRNTWMVSTGQLSSTSSLKVVYRAWHRQVIDGRRRFRHQGLATGGAQVPCRGVHQLTMRIQNILQIWGKCRWRGTCDYQQRHHLDSSTLWPFQYKDIIARLYARKDYPKHAPNTVVPEYSCSMHAKYACLHDAMVLQNGLVTTHFVAWVDIGYYRTSEIRTLATVHMPNFNRSARDIFYGNYVWVGGGMFIATREVMLKLCDEYKRAATFFLLERNLSSTDQQVIHKLLVVLLDCKQQSLATSVET